MYTEGHNQASFMIAILMIILLGWDSPKLVEFLVSAFDYVIFFQ